MVAIFCTFLRYNHIKMYSLMTVRELQAELRRRNASVAGKKAALIERLEAYNRNQNFGADFEVQDDNIFVCPLSDTFRDINAESPIPAITKHEIQEYFLRFNTHPKGQLLYESRHLVTARFSCDGSFTYLRGQCKASMKKVTYVVNIKVSQEGAIEECNCECAAGSGTSANCKHVAVLLFGVYDMVHSKTMKLHQVCTQELMMFKKPKKVFYNSPIAAQNLPSKRAKRCNFSPLKNTDIMDKLQTYEPANPHGVEWDHSYIHDDPKKKLLEALLLENVDENKIITTEKNTRLQSMSPNWHEMRSCRITASMFYVVSHSTLKGQDSILQKILCPKSVNTRALTHGRIQEPIALQKYEMEYGLNVERCGCPFLAASPDGLIGKKTVVEVKCPYASRYSMINEVTVPYLESVDGKLCLKKRHPYYAQIQGQLYCTKRKYCNFIVYTFKDMKVLFVSKDEEYINEMLTTLTNFYVHFLEPAILNKYLYKDYSSLIKKHLNYRCLLLFFIMHSLKLQHIKHTKNILLAIGIKL